MKNVIKYIGVLVILILLIVNTISLNKLIVQNGRNEAELTRLEQLVNAIKNSNISNQGYQTQQPAQKEIMTPSELAKYLGVDMDKVYVMVENKDAKIPYINIDGEYKFSKAAIDEWMKTSNEITTRK